MLRRRILIAVMLILTCGMVEIPGASGASSITVVQGTRMPSHLHFRLTKHRPKKRKLRRAKRHKRRHHRRHRRHHRRR